MTEVEYTMIWFMQLLMVVVLVALIIKLSELTDKIKTIAQSVNQLAFVSQACTTYLTSLQHTKANETGLNAAQDLVNGHG